MKAYLDGVLLEQGPEVGWSLQAGTAAHVRSFLIDEVRANGLYQNATLHGSTLVLDARDDGGPHREFKKLTILGTGPTRIRGVASLTLADRRWIWPRTPFYQAFNLRRRTGERRRIKGGPPAVQAIADDVAYRTSTLRDGQFPWTGSEMLGAVLDAQGEWRRQGKAGEELPVIEGLEIDDAYDFALGRALSYFGLALGVYLDPDGALVLFDRLDGTERELVGATPAPGGADPGGGTRTAQQAAELKAHGDLGPPLVGGPLWAVQDRRMERPSSVVVYFERAVELRVDHREESDGSADLELSGTATGSENQVTPPRLVNVLQIPEDATLNGREVVEGTWVPLKDYLDWLEGKEIGTATPLSAARLRDGYISPTIDTWALGDPFGMWPTRVQVIKSSYRLQFQVTKIWLDRIRSMRAYRVAVLDNETGARAPAAVYIDWSRLRNIVPQIWAASRGAAGPDSEDWRMLGNRFANPTGPRTGGPIIGTPIQDMRPAPARVRIEDEDQGILTLDFRNDTTGATAAVFPSAVVDATIPSHHPEARNRYLQFGKLTPTHEVSIVLTVAPAAPNDLRRFHKVTVGADEAKLPNGGPVGQAKGPEYHIRVSSLTTVARFPWDDSNADEVYKAFTPGQSADLTDALGDPVNLGEVTEVAKAIAAKVYAQFADHVEGGIEVPFAADATIKGTVRVVTHTFSPGGGEGLSQGGGATTRVDFPSEPPPVNAESLLPEGTRRLIRRMVDP